MTRGGQRGFTLIELLTTVTATGIVILAANAFMLRALSWYDELSAKIEMNRHARLAYETWAYGGMATSNGKDGTKYVYGIRGSNKEPPKGDLRNGNSSLKYKQNNLTLNPDQFATMTVQCLGDNIPIPVCKADLNPKSVNGWLGDDPDIKKKAGSIGNGWATVTFTITDPFQVQRGSAWSQSTDTYQTVFTLNRTENDP